MYSVTKFVRLHCCNWWGTKLNYGNIKNKLMETQGVSWRSGKEHLYVWDLDESKSCELSVFCFNLSVGRVGG